MALDLVSPLIPSGQDSKGPELFLQAMGQGLQAASRFAQMKRDTEMDMLKLAEHERLAQEQNVLDREKMAQDYDIRQTALQSTMELNTAHADYYKAGARAYTEGTKTGAQRATKRLEQETAHAAEISKHASELRLDDPNFVTKEPIQFAANVLQFEDSWKRSPLPWVKDAIKKYRTEADQHKITIKTGATYDELADKWEGGKSEEVPLWQVVRNFKDPDQQEAMLTALQAGGHTTTVEELQEIAGQKVPTKTTKPTALVNRALEEGKNVEFKRVPSRVPPASAPRSAYDTLPDPNEEAMPDGFSQPQTSAPRFDQTQTDAMIQQARAAISKGAPRAAVEKRLQEMGINPQVLQE